ncbi:S8 family peptidase [Glutamicibacter sp. FBE19]|nr:S8 family peptidase [Glutamicibacter sp. FBE19]MBF6671165.1 S8 family peptidase [Glutamicibacter sp. FBE19]
MTGEGRPLLALGAPEIGNRIKQRPSVPPKVQGPGSGRQGERLAPKFRELIDAFASRRAHLSPESSDEVDPELVLVFDLAGSIADFRNAVNKIEGLEFLAELLDEETEPDDDFHLTRKAEGRVDGGVGRSLQLVMSNAKAAGQLVKLFNDWVANPKMTFQRGLAKFRTAFEQLRAIRRWGPEDRILETGLIENWKERLEVVGQYFSPVLVEVELWYRREAQDRRHAESHLTAVILESGGSVKSRSEIAGISYHALLVELPIQQVSAVLERGAEAISILTADEVMFVGPCTPMSVTGPGENELISSAVPIPSEKIQELPRIALLDGLPFGKHDCLAGRLTIDDPDGLGEDYEAGTRFHGTAMASLIIHGDLSAPSKPLDRRLYVRPIMRPHEYLQGIEHVLNDELFTDLLHRAILRIVGGEGGLEPEAPSVRIINLSVGVESRAFVRKMSPLGRLLDWLALEKNLLFIVSAGNHSQPIYIPAADALSSDDAGLAALKATRSKSRQRGILPPGDALNAITVGAIHADESGEIELPDGVWDLVDTDMPAHYSAVGPGIGRSIKPDIYHSGGRVLYSRPVINPGDSEVQLQALNTPAFPPGTMVAAPARGGSSNALAFTHGTSNATALVTREASRIFDVLEAGADLGDPSFPAALYHPVLTKALLIHSSEWGSRAERLRQLLDMDPQQSRRELSTLLGYGAIDTSRLGNAATNRAVLITGGSIEREQRHTYQIPLPQSLRSRPEWHRVTVTLAYMAPTSGQLNRYRGTNLYFDTPDKKITAGSRTEAEFHNARRGSCQHEIFEGAQSMLFGPDGTLPLNIECMKDGATLKKGTHVRYGLVVSVETRVETSTLIHDEVRARLKAMVQAQSRQRIHS